MCKAVCSGVFAVLLMGSAGIATAQTYDWDPSQVSRIEIDGVAGDVIVRAAPGGMGSVVLVEDVRPAGQFRPHVRHAGDAMYVEEDWGTGQSDGRVEWTIYVPRESAMLELIIRSSSGDVEAEDVALLVDFRSASGDIHLANVQLGPRSAFRTASGDYRLERMTLGPGCRFDTASGDLDLEDITISEGCALSTASGDIVCSRCKGYLDLSSSSGDVDVRDSEIEGEAELSSASGDVSVYLDRLRSGLTASSASGDVLLDVPDLGSDFQLVLIKRVDRGHISSPFEYTSESTFTYGRHVYERKVVHRGSGRPGIELRTASGSVRVRG